MLNRGSQYRLWSLLAAVALLLAACQASTDTGAEPTEPEPTEVEIGTDQTSGDASDQTSGDASDQTSGDTSAAGGDTVVFATSSEINNLDISRYQVLLDHNLLVNVYDSLTKRDRDGSVVPMIVTDWETSEEGLTWTVNLRDDVVFHNGDPMTAEDVAFSMMRAADPEFAHPIVQYWEMVEEAEVVDDYTVRFHLSEPNPLFMHTGVNLWIVPKDYLEEVGEEAFQREPVGTGPYKVVEWRPDDRLTLEAHEDYWQGAPAIPNVIFRPITEEASRTAALRSGEVDIAYPISLDQLDVIEADPALEVRPIESLERMRLILDSNVPPFDDVRVRKAVNYAIDVDAIVDGLMEGYSATIPALTVPLEPGHDPDLEPYPYDPDTARQLLEEAGHGDGLTVGFAVRTGYTKGQEIGEAIAGYLADVGINTQITLMDDAEFTTEAENKTLPPLSLSGWGGGGQFDGTHVYRIAERCEGGSAALSGFYCNPEVDALMDEAISLWATDQERAIELIKEGERIYHEDAGAGFLFMNSRVYAAKSGLEWDPHPTGDLWMFDASWK